MKRRLLKKHNQLLAFILSLLGIGGACTFSCCAYGTPVEYGTPHATFKVYGKVTSEDNTEIPNARVVLQEDTAYTNENGNYNVQVIEFPSNQDFLIEFMDIDGNTNGAYQSKDTIVSFQDPVFENGENPWYSGETSKEIDIKLKEDN